MHTNSIPSLTYVQIALFWAKAAVFAEHQCWLWEGGTDSRGYGRYRVDDRVYYAHRIAYTIAFPEQDIDGLTLDHLCGNIRCVNPSHLEPVTASENSRRRAAPDERCKRGHRITPANSYISYYATEDRVVRLCRMCQLEKRQKNRTS